MRLQPSKRELIEDLQRNYTSPDPDLAYEAELREKFLHKAMEAERKKNFFRRTGIVGTVTAALVLGIAGYLSQPTDLDPYHAAEQAQLKSIESELWRPIDISKMEEVFQATAIQGAIRVYMDSTQKELYAAKGDQGFQLFHLADGVIEGAKVYQSPIQPERYYVWFSEVRRSDRADRSTLTNHLILLHEDGTFKEFTDIPQAGFHSQMHLELSPSGKKAFLALDSTQEWIVGELDSTNSTFVSLYGEMSKQVQENLYDFNAALNPWQVTWINETTLLVFNPGANAFYGVNTENQSAWEIKAGIPLYSDGYRIKKVTIPEGSERFAIVQVGKVNLDASFSGTEQTYVLDLEQSKYRQIPVENGSKGAVYDQVSLVPMPEDKSLISTVLLSNPKVSAYELQLGVYNLQLDQYDTFFTKNFKDPLFVDSTVKLSKTGKLAAVKLHTYPLDGGARQHLLVIDLETGTEVMKQIDKEHIIHYEFGDDGSFKVDGQIYIESQE